MYNNNFLLFIRCRSSRGENLDSVGTRSHTMEINGGNRHHHHHHHPLPPPPPSPDQSQQPKQLQQHVPNGNGCEQWSKLTESQNGHVKHQV